MVHPLFCIALFQHMLPLPISFRITSLALGQSHDCPSASEATLNDMGKCIIWIYSAPWYDLTKKLVHITWGFLRLVSGSQGGACVICQDNDISLFKHIFPKHKWNWTPTEYSTEFVTTTRICIHVKHGWRMSTFNDTLWPKSNKILKHFMNSTTYERHFISTGFAVSYMRQSTWSWFD